MLENQSYIKCLALLLLGLIGFLGYGQTVIYTQDFENPGGYNTSVSEFNDGMGNYFERTNNPDPDVQLNNIQGSFYFAAQDIVDGNTQTENIIFSNIDITGFSNLELRVYMAEDDDGSNEDWDGEDFVHFSVDIDNNGYNNIINVEGQNNTNNAPQIDTDFNGIGDGAEITNTFTQFSSNIAGFGNTLNLRIEMRLNSGDEDIAIDQIEIVGTPASTNVQFDQSTASVSENTGTVSLDVNIFNEDANSTSVDVALTSGNPADVDNYTTQTLTFPSNSSASQTLPINVTDNLISNPDKTLVFTLQNPTGGNSAIIGTQDTFTLTILDDESAQPSLIFEDFDDGDFTNNPTWINGPGTNSTAFEVLTDTNIPNGNATTDGLFLASDPSFGDMSLAVPSTEVNEWQFSLASPSFNPSSSNFFGVVLMANASFIGNILGNNFQGYYLRLGTDGSTDRLELWRKTGAGQVKIDDFPSSPNFGAGALRDGLNIRITRSDLGEFELFYSTGFEYDATPTNSAGTLTDNNYNSSSYFGVFQNFANQGSSRRVYIDNIDLIESTSSINQFIINFDDDANWTAGSSPISSYASNHTYQDLNWLFTDGPALRNTTTNQDGFQGAQDVYSWRIEDSPDAFWSGIYQGNEVITTFGFDVRRWDSSPEPDYSIEYSIDGGVNFISTGDIINNSFLNDSSDWFTYEFEIPSIQHHDTDNFILQLTRDGGERIIIDNFLYEIALEDTDSQLLAPDTQVEEGDLIVGEAVDTFDAVSVFAFKLQDSGSGDGLPTIVNSMRFIAGNQNTAIFNEVIDEVVIYVDDTRIFNSSTIVSLLENEINIEFDYSEGNASSLLEIADNTTKNIEVRVSVNQTGMVSGETFQIAIDDNSLGFGVARDSSIFSRNILPISGNEFEIRVNATQLNFVQQSQYAKVNNVMPFGVSVSASDAVGNIDRSITGQVELYSTGSLQSSPLTANFVDGIATFNNIIHTATGNDLELTATDLNVILSPTTSLSFDIRNPLELFISEITDPLNTPGGRYVEIYNHSVDTIDFNSENVFLVIEFNGGSSYRNIQLTGQLPPKSYYLVGQDEFSTHYGFSAQIEEVINPVASGDGNDTYFLSFGGNDNEERIRNFFDIYGEVGVDALSSTPWFYQEKIVYRKNPNTTEETQIWDSEEWDFISGPGTIESATPSYGNQDYIYENNSIQWNGIGAGDPMIGAGVSNQENIEIREGEVSLFGDIEVHDLIVRNGATLELEPNVKLTVHGDILNEGKIIFDSDATGTAVLESVAENTRIVGNEFEVRRYIPVVQTPNPIRAFRYLSSSVDTQNSAKPTINDNWQEGLFNPDINTNNPGTAGFGTHITGTDLGDNLGFDATATGNPSMFEYDSNGQNWMSVPNTNSKTFGIGDAFAILVRGDRTTTLDSNSAVGPSTTLRTTGQIHVGDFTLDSSELAAQDFFTLVGNPYQSQVDLKALITNSSIDKHVYIYDPTIGDLGNTITLDLSMETVSPTPSSSANQYLQPNQAFFVKTIGSSPQINFTESTKNNTGSQTGVFNEQPDDITQLDISIKNANQELQDGIRIVYGDAYSNTVNYDDATKLFNSGETIAIESSSAYLSIEKRDWPNPMEVTNLNLYNLTLSDYVLSLDFQLNNTNMPEVYLVDHYTGQNTLVSTNALTDYSFSVDANIPESIASDRFQLSYSSSLSVDNFEKESFLVYPNPLKASDLVTITSTDIDLETIKSIEINTIQGKIIRSIPSSKLNKYGNSVQLKLNSTISKGTYFLKIIAKENNYICKLIIN